MKFEREIPIGLDARRKKTTGGGAESAPPPMGLGLNIEFDVFSTVEPRYNKDLGTMKMTLYQVKKQRNIESWDQQNYLVTRGFC